MDYRIEEQDKLRLILGKEKFDVYSSEKLFGNSNEIGILFNQELYKIRITKNGKLIMSK